MIAEGKEGSIQNVVSRLTKKEIKSAKKKRLRGKLKVSKTLVLMWYVCKCMHVCVYVCACKCRHIVSGFHLVVHVAARDGISQLRYFRRIANGQYVLVAHTVTQTSKI